MESQVLIKTWGITQGWHKGQPRWFVVSDGGWQTSLHYAKPEKARKEAYKFIRAVYKDFTNFQGVPIHFEFHEVNP